MVKNAGREFSVPCIVFTIHCLESRGAPVPTRLNAAFTLQAWADSSLSFTIHYSPFTVQKCLHPNAHPLPFILTLSSGYRRRILRTGSCLIGRGAHRRFARRRCRRRSRGAGLGPDHPGSLFQPPLQILLDSLSKQVHPKDEVIVHGQENLDIEPAVEEVLNGAGRSGCPFLEMPVQ